MQAQDRPVFRQDLVAEAIEEHGAKFIDVMDPDSGNMFRFFEVEYSLACAMDGQRDVAGIVKWAQEELGLTPSPKEVQSVIATLADLRFIETGAARLSDVPEAKAAAKGAFDSEATTVGSSPFKDDDLAAGIVVGAAPPPPASIDVELGHAGTATPVAARDDMPKADFDLGAPGAQAAAARPPKPPVEDVALGAPGAREAGRVAPAADLSMDLSLDVAIKPSDVKEAVRASKVMTAVDVPKELQDELDKPAAKPVAAAAKPVEKAPVAAAAKPVEKTPVAPVVAKPAEKAPIAAKKPAVSLPKTPEKQPVAPPAPQQKVNPVLIVLLIVAVVGAGAFLFWKLVLNKPESTESTQKQPAPPPPPPAPTEATSKVALDTPAAAEIKSPAGTLETIEAADKDVKAGDVLGTLVGAKVLTTELANLQKEIEKGTPTIEAAQKELADAQQKENNAAGVSAAQAKLVRIKKPIDDKTAALAKKQADLDKLTIKSQADGKLTTTAKVGQKVVADEVIGTVVRATVPTATFKIPPTVKLAADGNVSLTAGDKTVVCTVTDAQTESIKVTCPPDSGLENGADVKFQFPK